MVATFICGDGEANEHMVFTWSVIPGTALGLRASNRAELPVEEKARWSVRWSYRQQSCRIEANREWCMVQVLKCMIKSDANNEWSVYERVLSTEVSPLLVFVDGYKG